MLREDCRLFIPLSALTYSPTVPCLPCLLPPPPPHQASLKEMKEKNNDVRGVEVNALRTELEVGGGRIVGCGSIMAALQFLASEILHTHVLHFIYSSASSTWV